MNSAQCELFSKDELEFTTVKIVNLKIVKEKSLKYNSSVYTPHDIAELVKPIFNNSYRELVVVVGLDTRNSPTIIHLVSCGSTCQSPVFISNVIKPLLLSNSSAFVLIHNHPADSLEPSSADKELTRRLKEAGKLLDLEIVDHVIVNHDCSDCFSIRSSHHWPSN